MADQLRTRVYDILSTEHRVSTTRLGGLSQKDRRQMEAVARGELTPEYRVKALSVLAAMGDPAGADIFRRALADHRSGIEIRAAGATLLSRVGGMAAEGALVEALRAADEPIVHHKVIAGLARIGSESALRQLDDAVPALDPATAEHARFARSVIAYRHGLSGYELPVVDDERRLRPGDDARSGTISMVAAQPEDAHRVIEQVQADSFGVSGDRAAVAMLSCGPRTLALVVDGGVAAEPGRLFERPALPGFVALQADSDGSFSTAYLLLTMPDGQGGAHVSVNRPTGPTAFFGEARHDGSVVRFTLDAVAAPGATAATITGMLAEGRITELSGANGATQAPRRPTPMTDG